MQLPKLKRSTSEEGEEGGSGSSQDAKKLKFESTAEILRQIHAALKATNTRLDKMQTSLDGIDGRLVQLRDGIQSSFTSDLGNLETRLNTRINERFGELDRSLREEIESARCSCARTPTSTSSGPSSLSSASEAEPIVPPERFRNGMPVIDEEES